MPEWRVRAIAWWPKCWRGNWGWPVVERVSLAEVAANLPILYSDALYAHPKVHHWRAARVRAEAETPVPAELDGEPVGTLPLDVEVLPQALRFILPPLRQAGR